MIAGFMGEVRATGANDQAPVRREVVVALIQGGWETLNRSARWWRVSLLPRAVLVEVVQIANHLFQIDFSDAF